MVGLFSIKFRSLMSFFSCIKKYLQISDQIVAIISHMLQNFSSNDDKCLKIFIRDLPQKCYTRYSNHQQNRVFSLSYIFFFVYNLHLWIFVSAQNILKIYFWMLNLCNFIPDARGYKFNVFVNNILLVTVFDFESYKGWTLSDRQSSAKYLDILIPKRTSLWR